MSKQFSTVLNIRAYKSRYKALLVLIGGLLLTVIFTCFTYRYIKNRELIELNSIGMEISLKIDARLRAHALILRAGASYMSVTDTVTREDWKEYIQGIRLDINMPGIEGIGYTVIVPPEQLEEHINTIRAEGFPEYNITPEGDRDLYTSILYLEPFSGRNLRAFGYDMFSEPIRRKAMELSRDNNVAMLSGKVGLVQETGVDLQAGTLMYVPYYDPHMPATSVEERRAAIKGWVYSPYRMRDLMRGILGLWDETNHERVRLQIYDDSLSINSLLYDSQVNNAENSVGPSPLTITRPVEFNGKQWLLVFSRKHRVTSFHLNVIIVFVSGLIISFLLYLLALSYFKIANRSRQIKRQNVELSKLNATKDKFFSIIAHDLKSPFNSIIGFSSILMEHIEMKKYDGISRFAEIIHQSSNAAMDLLMNLMEWSQSQTGRIVFNPAKFDFKELVDEVEMLFSDAASLKSITIENVMPERLEVFGDYDMISTVMRNLISNSIKFTHQGGKVTVKAWKETSTTIVSVEDNGVGIPTGKVDKLFKIDETLSTKGTQDEKGTGLGLILCKEFVEKHRGKIWVESRESLKNDEATSGTIFYFTLPDNL